MRPRATGASDRIVTFTDGSELAVDAVIWATGFEFDHSWIEPAVKDEKGAIQHRRGVTPSRASIFSDCPGSTHADRLCSAGSRTTLNTSPSRSQAGQPTDRRARRDELILELLTLRDGREIRPLKSLILVLFFRDEDDLRRQGQRIWASWLIGKATVLMDEGDCQ